MELCSRAIKLFLIVTFCFAQMVHADWESTLKSSFDIVDTFDNITPWWGTSTGYIDNPAVMPNKTDSSDSIWRMYSTDYVGTSETPWIGDHGTGNNWSGGQSLCINYHLLYTDNPLEIRGHGPSRLATFFGDGVTGNSGYETIHIFYMQKYAPGYFKLDPTDGVGYAQYTSGYNKLADILSGFTEITHWGNESEYNSVCTASSSAGRDDYGLNGVIVNAYAGGATFPTRVVFGVGSVFRAINDVNNCPEPTTTPYYSGVMPGMPLYFQSTDVASAHDAGEWFGVEITAHIGTIGVADGYVTIKTYNSSGALIGQQTQNNLECLRLFNHKYNKFVFGGNRAYTDPATNEITTESRIYYDDFIINDSEIAPTYFSLLSTYNENAPEITFTTTNNQTVSSSPMTVEGTVAAVSGTLTGMTVNGTPILPTDGAWDEASETFTTSLTLSEGLNSIPFIATDSGGLSTTTYFNVTYTPAGYVAPIVEILTESQSTTEATITIMGTLTTDSALTGSGVDVNGVTATADDGTWDEAVEWWTASNVPLSLGENLLIATGLDPEMQEGTDSVSITRTAIPPGASAGVTIQGVQWNQ